MMVNNEIGTVLPYETLIPALRRKAPKVLLHMDAVQGFTKYPVSMKRLDLDFLTFSGHKLYAPKGIGVLYIKKGTDVYKRQDKIGHFFVSRFMGQTAEEICLLCLDSSCRLVRCETLSEGGVNGFEISPRRIVEVALQCKATNLILGNL